MILRYVCMIVSGLGLLIAFLLQTALCAEPMSAAASPRDALRVVRHETSVSFFVGERLVVEYRRVPSLHKPFVSKLFSPASVQILRDAPSDHKHHHALMFALAAGDVNFWEEREESGSERPMSERLLKERETGGMRRAGFSQLLDWVDAGGSAILTEQRTVEVLDGPDLTATLLDWHSRLETGRVRDSVLLSGSHYFGLGMRFVESMDRGGRFFNPEGLAGEVVRGSERLTPARWCAYAANVEGLPVTVAIFDHPANPRHPARMFTMSTPFAYLAATLNLHKEALTLKRGSPMTLRYGIALWDGTAEPAQVEVLYRRWAAQEHAQE